MSLTQYFITSFRPRVNAIITKLVYSGSLVQFGKNFKCDSIPKIVVDRGCHVIIGDNVEFRRSVEIRAHGKSKVHLKGDNRIDRGVRILAANSAEILVENGAKIGLYSVLNGGDSITIGKKALISGFVYLQTSMHGFRSKDVGIQDQGFEHAPIVMEDDTWLGAHVVIMPGVSLGEGSVVGSNAVVNKSVASNMVVGGIPAKELKSRI